MNYLKRWKYLLLSCVAILTLSIGATAVFASTASENAAQPAFLGDDGQPDFGRRGGFGDKLALLADALGITVEELQAAQQQAHEAAVQQALDQGLITQEQADRLLLRGNLGRKAGPRGHMGRLGEDIDPEALLADALGITVENLQAARVNAQEAGIQQALDEGYITQEQVDRMKAAQALKSYLNPEAIMAQALGISVEDMQTARAEKKPLSTLLEEQGLDAATLRTNMQTAREAAIQQAVADEVISQEQADQFLSSGLRGFGGQGFKGGRGFHGDHNFKGGRGFGAPQNAPEQAPPASSL